jgi:hypothetical protein
MHLIATLASTCCLLLAGTPADECRLATQDGLTLHLDARSGALRAVSLAGRQLPLISGASGGLSCRLWSFVQPASARSLIQVDFESPNGWTPIRGGQWPTTGRVAAERRTDGGALGSAGYVRLGAAKQFGHGIGLSAPLPVVANRSYEISWHGRAAGQGSTFIAYVRLLDAAGRDVTAETPSPQGWQYSPFSKTHYQDTIAPPADGQWGKIERRYRVPAGVAALRIAICLWRGESVDVDQLAVREVAGAQPGATIVPSGPLTALPGGNGWRQRSRLAGQPLEVELTYLPKANHLRVEAELRDVGPTPRDQAVEVCYTLPIQSDGWSWHDDIRRRRAVVPGGVYTNDFGYAGHRVARYPLACATSADAGLALAVPMDYPVMQTAELSARRGLGLSWDLGLSANAGPAQRGCARFAWTLFSVDPKWGFRSATAKYYRMFPESFVKRATREGCWLWPVAPGGIRGAEDFGLTFWEASNPKPAQSAAARALGMYVLTYIEPCGVRQWHPEVRQAGQMPTEADAREALRRLATDRLVTKHWPGGPSAPQPEIAQAILNSLPETVGPKPLHPISDEYNAWARHWFTNPSPHLAAPNRGSVAWTREILPTLDHADGVYVDSVEIWQTNYENYRPEHLQAAQGPLTFSRDTARPNLPASLGYRDFLAWLGAELHRRDKLLMLNVFAEPPAYRFYAHLGDVTGSEVSSSWTHKARSLTDVESDPLCCLRRTYAYRKPVANLLQEGNWNKPRPAVTRQEIEQYIQHQLFYGFYPGISTIGGEDRPGYATWKRYFGSEQCDRDRDLFKRYIPILRRINAAGWEPVTYATAQPATVLLERFGQRPYGGLYLTVRNPSDAAQRARLNVDLNSLGISGLGRRLTITDLVSQRPVSFAMQAAAGAADVELSLEPHQTAVLQIEQPVQ